MSALSALDAALGEHAQLPRDNGELVFDEPWQGRALGMGVVALERSGCSWPEFREHLVAAIATRAPEPGESAATAYYAAWLDALEGLLGAWVATGQRVDRSLQTERGQSPHS